MNDVGREEAEAILTEALSHRDPEEKEELAIASQSTKISSVPTLCQRALEIITDEQLAELFTEVRHPQSTLRKEKWVFNLFDQFCIRAGKSSSLPCDMSIIRAFLRFLGTYAHYSLNSIEYIVGPTLRRLHIEAGGSREIISSTLSSVIRELRSTPGVKKDGQGKPPLCSFDLLELVQRLPDHLPSKAQDVSLFLFGHHTGSRAITCAGIRVGDLRQLEKTDTGLTCIEVRQRVTKGNPNWNHLVTIEGYLDTYHPLDAVYWLNLYVQKRFAMDLISLIDKVSEDPIDPLSETSLWGLSKDAMRERLKKRLSQAGFPDHRWAFHSLRSGFICSALFTAGADESRRAAVLETTAIVAGWQVHGKAQRRYIKSSAERMIVASRLLGLGIGSHLAADDQGPTKVASSGFVKLPNDSQSFHNFKFSPPCFDSRMYLQAVVQVFTTAFYKHHSISTAKRYSRNCFNAVLVHWGRLQSKKSNTKLTYPEYRKLGHSILEDRLIVQCESPDGLAKEMLSLLPRLGYDIAKAPDLKHMQIVHVADNTLKREVIEGQTGRQSLKRRRWTKEEDTVIINARKDGKPMSGIIKQLPDRRISDAYDRLKVLKRKGVISKDYVKPRKAKPIPENPEEMESGRADSVRVDLRLGLAKEVEEETPKPPILAKTGKLPTVGLEQTTSESESESEEESNQDSSSGGLEDIKMFEAKHKCIIKEFASLF